MIEKDIKNKINFEPKFLCGAGLEKVDVVDLQTAKHLKKLGYSKPSYWFWLDEDLPHVEWGLYRVKMGKRRVGHNKYDEFIYSAPTKEEFEKWLKSL